MAQHESHKGSLSTLIMQDFAFGVFSFSFSQQLFEVSINDSILQIMKLSLKKTAQLAHSKEVSVPENVITMSVNNNHC